MNRRWRGPGPRLVAALTGAAFTLAAMLGPVGGPLLSAQAAPARKAGALELRRFASAAEALEVLLRQRPRVIAFGEVHQQKGAEKIPSSLKRFTEQLLPVFERGRPKQKASDVILETWINDGQCGAEEKKVVETIQQTTKRPEQTENELVTAIKRAKAAGIDPHILRLSCKQYESLRERAPDGGLTADLDYDKLLRLIRRLLMQQLILLLVHRGGASATGVILIYGGALHNDIRPRKDDEPYAFGAAAQKAVQGRYLEVDLLVPEYIDRYEAMMKEPWWALYRAEHDAPDGGEKVLLIRQGAGSYVIIFPRSPVAPAPTPPAPPTPAR